MAPYLAHELWEMTGETSNLLKAPWPKYDPALAAEDEIEIPVQVNGKLRGLVVVPAGASDDQVEQAALAERKSEGGDRGQADGEEDRGAGKAREYRGASKRAASFESSSIRANTSKQAAQVVRSSWLNG